MKILFCHDHVFYSFNNEYYSAGKLSLEQMFVYKKALWYNIINSKVKMKITLQIKNEMSDFYEFKYINK